MPKAVNGQLVPELYFHLIAAELSPQSDSEDRSESVVSESDRAEGRTTGVLWRFSGRNLFVVVRKGFRVRLKRRYHRLRNVTPTNHIRRVDQVRRTPRVYGVKRLWAWSPQPLSGSNHRDCLVS